MRKCNNSSEYLQKVHLELALSDWKKGKKTGRLSAFALLYLYSESKAEWAAQKFYEFATTMKGKTQLKYSKGLRDYYNIEIKSDEQISEDLLDKDYLYLAMKSYISL